jgi:hypothetical protein
MVSRLSGACHRRSANPSRSVFWQNTLLGTVAAVSLNDRQRSCSTAFWKALRESSRLQNEPSWQSVPKTPPHATSRLSSVRASYSAMPREGEVRATPSRSSHSRNVWPTFVELKSMHNAGRQRAQRSHLERPWWESPTHGADVRVVLHRTAECSSSVQTVHQPPPRAL